MNTGSSPSPDRTLYIVGDIHGCSGKLDRLLDAIDADDESRGGPPAMRVFVGDYVDRGDASADVLRRLHEIATERAGAVTCLLGNHERMMLDFIANPSSRTLRWLRYGGLQTLASFGVGGITDAAPASGLIDAAADLRRAIGRERLRWLRDRPLRWSSGNVWIVHAGAKPDFPMEDQDDRTLLWGSSDFLTKDRSDGAWVAFGHTIVDAPYAEGGRIAVDTGAYEGGPLTAARVDPDGHVRFLQGH